MLPNVILTDPIASRSHFNIIYNPETDKYQVMDAGSKWGTFTKVSREGRAVSCGDWIRLGNVELVVRFCGGGCACHRQHQHYRLHSLRIAKSVCSQPSFLRSGLQAATPWRNRLQDRRNDDLGEDDQEDDAELDVNEVLHVLDGSNVIGTSKPWTSTYHKLARVSGFHVLEDATRINSPSSADSPRKQAKPDVSAPGAPLEFEFISGPRMGERLLLVDRTCTLGRGENCTVKLNSATLANISRVHCVFQCIGDRWLLRDNGSTNGTWQRLSCVLEPSKPVDLNTGDAILAGTQELKVEEVEMPRWCISSTVSKVFR